MGKDLMEALHLVIRPQTAFGGPIRGDTLFGQLCWSICNRLSEERLIELLADYRERPFAVCSDAFPCGFLPRPALPLHRYEWVIDEDRKAVRKRRWLPAENASRPVREWLKYCVNDAEAAEAAGADRLAEEHPQPHNSIHRSLGTTYGSEFSPYSLPQYWYGEGLKLDLWVAHLPQRITGEELYTCLSDIGRTGYGRDSSIGLGKFEIESCEAESLPGVADGETCFTLAPSAPHGLGCDPARSFYHPFTRFGRHGNRAVLSGKPFKSPVLLADTGALLTPDRLPENPVVGQGLGGDGTLSKAIENTVQQGHAPCIRVHLGGAA